MAASTTQGSTGLSEAQLFVELEQLARRGEVTVDVERRVLNHLDFPLLSQADGNLIVYPSIALSVAVFWEWGMVPGSVALAASFLFYQTAGKVFMARRMRRRIVEQGMVDLLLWRKVWQFGGVILSAPGKGLTCRAPGEPWTQFVRTLVEPPPSGDGDLR